MCSVSPMFLWDLNTFVLSFCPTHLQNLLNADKQKMVLNMLLHSCKVVSTSLTRVSPHITVPDSKELNKCAVIPWTIFKS